MTATRPMTLSLLLPACLALFATLLPIAASAQDVPWHVATFSAEITLDGAPVRVTVNCESPKVCQYIIRPVATDTPPLWRNRTEGIEPVDALIPNNNLEHTRDAVRADAALYGEARDGPLLQALRPVLESKARYRHCVGLPERDGLWGQLCQLDTQALALPAAVLLLPTMNPTCGGAFCAYYAIPLQRQSDR